ncbi:MAG: mechanosensitive ion channel [Ruminococcaceae bacterium]|nr:mechanosensitive ion channel [Oscillospiraceae bacterium]
MLDGIINWFNSLGATALGRLLPFVLILLVGMIVIRIVCAIIRKALAKSKLEKAAHSLILSLTNVILYVLLLLTAASSLGIDITGIVALASVVTLAISLALQNCLTNLIGGFTLLWTHPFKSGDFVEIAGESGTVQEIGIAYTKLITPDNKLVQIPNGTVVANDITNFSCTGTRRVDINVSASYDAPVEKVMAALEKAGNVEGILADQPIFTNVAAYGDHAIEYVIRVWCPTEIYWDVHKAVTLNIKKVFDQEGIQMTYPHLNVHIEK